MADNFVSVTGNTTRDPELRFTPSGHAVANFGIAVNRRWQNRQTEEWEGEWWPEVGIGPSWPSRLLPDRTL